MSFASTITHEEVGRLELAGFSGSISVISDEGEAFDEAIDYLNTQKVIGFDTETKPCFVPKVPRNKVAILQLAGGEKVFIFRLQQLGVPASLATLLGNPSVLKIGAAVHDDIRGLQNYRDFIPRGFIDLQRMAEDYGIQEKSVCKMAAIILRKRVSKSQRLSNWESVQLSDAQLRYAAVDAFVCREMYYMLRKCEPVAGGR